MRTPRLPGLPRQRFPAAVDVRAGAGDDLAVAVAGIVLLLLLAPAARRARGLVAARHGESEVVDLEVAHVEHDEVEHEVERHQQDRQRGAVPDGGLDEEVRVA